MEKMENEFRALFRDVSPSMVIVEQVGRVGYFCIGSVILSEGESTFILTQSKITASSEKLSICFSNGFKQSATLLLKLEEEQKFCILMTKFYPKCKAIQFCKDDIDHTYVCAIAPANRSSVYNLPGFIIQKPCEVGWHGDSSLMKDGEDYFNFVCQYGDRSANRVSRLLSGPVFNLKSQALGFVIDDMEYFIWPKKKDGTIIHKELHHEYGFFLKIGLTVNRLQALLRNFWKLAEWIKLGPASSSPRALKSRSPSLPPKNGSPSKKVRSPSSPPKKASPPRKASPPAESAVLCIDHLSRNVNEAHLKEIFGNFGEIVNVEHSMDRTVNLPHGCGYIEFKKRADAEKALLYMDGGQIDGNTVKLRFALQPHKKAASPKIDAPQIEKGVRSAEKDAQQRPRESSPRRKPASPPRKRSPNQRAESPRRPPDPSPRRRPDSLPIRHRPDPTPAWRGDTPPCRRPLSPVRSPSSRRGRGSPSTRRCSPGSLRRRSPPPRRLRSPPRRPPPPRRYSRSPPRRPLRSRSRSISSRRGRGPPLRRGRSDSSYSRSPTPPPRKGPRRVSRSRSPRRPPRGRSIASDSRSSSSPPPRRGR